MERKQGSLRVSNYVMASLTVLCCVPLISLKEMMRQVDDTWVECEL